MTRWRGQLCGWSLLSTAPSPPENKGGGGGGGDGDDATELSSEIHGGTSPGTRTVKSPRAGARIPNTDEDVPGCSPPRSASSVATIRGNLATMMGEVADSAARAKGSVPADGERTVAAARLVRQMDALEATIARAATPAKAK